MLQRISLGRWNLGEASQRSIGDHDLEEYPLTARYVENFIVNDQAKISRRPGFIFQDEIVERPGRLIPFYTADTTYLFHFYIEGVELYFKIYSMQDTLFGRRLTASADSILVYTYTEDDFNKHPIPGVAINGVPFPHAPIPDEDVLSEYLKLLSYVQVREHIYLTQKFMQYPVHIFFDETGEYVTGGGWACLNYLDEHDLTDSYITNYVDVHWDTTDSIWKKTIQPNLATGGGHMDYGSGDVPLGFMYYTGNKPLNRYEEVPKTLEYLVGVTFIFNRLVWIRENVMHCTTNGDETQIGWQLRPETDDYDPNLATEIPPEVIASDAFATQIGSDLGHENLFWVSSGKALLGGANNGMWVLSNNQDGGLNAVNPLNYKTIADGIHWVPGKSIGDAFVYFQKPGNIMKEMVYSDNMQGYQAITLNYFADHIYESAKPTELVIQRSPFNIAWTLDESGAIAAMTYDRIQGVRGWSRCKFGTKYEKYNNESAKAKTLAVFAENDRDRLAAIIEREDGNYLELMDITGKGVDESLYLDSSSIVTQKSADVTDIVDAGGHLVINCENTFEIDDLVRFKDFTLEDYTVSSLIYGIWKVIEATATYIRIVDEYGIEYTGTLTYINYGIVEKVSYNVPVKYINLLPSLHNKHLKVVLDRIPYNVYLTNDGRLLDTTVEVEEGEEFPELGIAWNRLEIGFGYESIFSPYIIKKQLHRAKINEIELELYKSFGGKIGIADLTWDYKLEMIRMVDLTYPTTYDIEKTFTGTIKPAIVGGYSDEPLWFLYISDGTPLNLSNVIFYLEAR